MALVQTEWSSCAGGGVPWVRAVRPLGGLPCPVLGLWSAGLPFPQAKLKATAHREEPQACEGELPVRVLVGTLRGPWYRHLDFAVRVWGPRLFISLPATLLVPFPGVWPCSLVILTSFMLSSAKCPAVSEVSFGCDLPQQVLFL